MRYVPESHVLAYIHVTIQNENMAVFLNGPVFEFFFILIIKSIKGKSLDAE